MINLLRRLKRTNDTGQTLVEFAVVLPVFLIVITGIFDVGRVVYANTVLSQSAREAARLAAAEASWMGVSHVGCVSDSSQIGSSNPGAHVCPATAADLKEHVVGAANAMAVSVGAITVHLSCNDGSEYDPIPSGAWTDGVGGKGNGCATGAAKGDTVSVRVTRTEQAITPVIGSFLGSMSLSGSASMVVH